MSDTKASATPAAASGDTEMSMDKDSSAGLKNKSMEDVTKAETKEAEVTSELTAAGTAKTSVSNFNPNFPNKGCFSLHHDLKSAVIQFTLPKITDLKHLKKFIRNSSQFNTIEYEGMIRVIIRYNTYHFRDDFKQLKKLKINKKTLRNLSDVAPPYKPTLVHLNNLPEKAEPELLEMLFPKAETITISKRKCRAMMMFSDITDAEQCLVENQDLVIENKQLTMDIMDFNKPSLILMTNDPAYKGNTPINQNIYEDLLLRMSQLYKPLLNYDRVDVYKSTKRVLHDECLRVKLVDKLAEANFGKPSPARIQKAEAKSGKHAPAQLKKRNDNEYVKKEKIGTAYDKPRTKPPEKRKEPPRQRETLWDNRSPDRQARKRFQDDRMSGQPDTKKARFGRVDWICRCRFMNFAYREFCKQCRAKRPVDDQMKSPERGPRKDSDSHIPWRCQNIACGVTNSWNDMACTLCKLPRNLDLKPIPRGDKVRRTSEPKRSVPNLMNLDLQNKYIKPAPAGMPANTSSDPQLLGPAKKGMIDTEVISMKVPAHHIPNIIGDRGEVRSLIQQESNCLLTFPDMDEPGLDIKTCIISGPPNMLGAARKMVEHIVGTTMNIVEVNVNVPQHAMPRVIGKQSLQEISMMHHVNCDLMHTRASPADRQILKISGHYDNVERVHDLMLAFIYSVMNDECNDNTLIDYVLRLQNNIQHDAHRPPSPPVQVDDAELRATISSHILQRVSRQLAEQEQMGLAVPPLEEVQKRVMDEVAAEMAEIKKHESMSGRSEIQQRESIAGRRDGSLTSVRRRPSRFEPEHRDVPPRRDDIEERETERQRVQERSRMEEEARRRLELREHLERAKLEKERYERELRAKERLEKEKREREEREKEEKRLKEEKEKRKAEEERIRRQNMEYREWEEKRLINQAHAKVEREKQLITEERQKLIQERRALERKRLEEEVEQQHRMLNEEQKLMKERKMLENAKRELEEKQTQLEKARLDDERRSLAEKSARMWKPAPGPPPPSNPYQDYIPNANMRQPTSYPNVSYNAAPAPPMQATPLPVPPRMPYGGGMPSNPPYSDMSAYGSNGMATSRPYGAMPVPQGPAPLRSDQMPNYNPYPPQEMRYPPAQQMARPSGYAASGMGSGTGSTGLDTEMQKLVNARVASAFAGNRPGQSDAGQSETGIDLAAVVARARRLHTEQLNTSSSNQPEQRQAERRHSPVRRSPERRWSPDRSSRRSRDEQRPAYSQRREQPESVPMTGINDLIMNIMANHN